METRFDGKEKRQSKRIRVRFIAEYQVDRPIEVRMRIGMGKEVTALMLDMSEGGMALLTEYDLPTGSILALNFTIINQVIEDQDRVIKITAKGEVRYNMAAGKNEHRLGICFTSISEKDKATVSNFIRAAAIRKPLDFPEA